MSLINEIIGESNFELVRSKIAEILATEISNQRTLITTAIAADPTPEELIELQLALSVLPEKVWEERAYRPQDSEMPMLNVMLANNSLSQIITSQTQQDSVNYVVEFYVNALSTDENNSDYLAAVKLHRLMGVCRSIIMYQEYQRLGFTGGFIGHRSVQNMRIAQPEEGSSDARTIIRGVFDVKVSVEETLNPISGVLLNGMDTNMKFLGEKGYFWTI